MDNPQKASDEENRYSYEDMKAAFEAGENFGETRALFYNTDSIPRESFEAIPDFEEWIKTI